MTDRRASCLHQAALCERRALLDRAEMRAFWLAEAAKWRRRAAEDSDAPAPGEAPQRVPPSGQPQRGNTQRGNT